MVQELVRKSPHGSPDASRGTEAGETDASAIARVQTQHNLDRQAVARAAHRIASSDCDLSTRLAGQTLFKLQRISSARSCVTQHAAGARQPRSDGRSFNG